MGERYPHDVRAALDRQGGGRLVLPEQCRSLDAQVVTPVLVFDIETVPDVAGLRKLSGIAAEVSDEQVAAMAFQRRRQATRSEEHTSELQSLRHLVCRLLLDK